MTTFFQDNPGKLVTRTHARMHTHTHTHPFNGPFSGTNQVSRYQKGKTNLDITEARDSEWQWHRLGHMQVCTSFRTDNHTSTSPLSFLQAGCPSCHPTNSIKALKAPGKLVTRKQLKQLFRIVALEVVWSLAYHKHKLHHKKSSLPVSGSRAQLVPPHPVHFPHHSHHLYPSGRSTLPPPRASFPRRLPPVAVRSRCSISRQTARSGGRVPRRVSHASAPTGQPSAAAALRLDHNHTQRLKWRKVTVDFYSALTLLVGQCVLSWATHDRARDVTEPVKICFGPRQHSNLDSNSNTSLSRALRYDTC